MVSPPSSPRAAVVTVTTASPRPPPSLLHLDEWDDAPAAFASEHAEAAAKAGHAVDEAVTVTVGTTMTPTIATAPAGAASSTSTTTTTPPTVAVSVPITTDLLASSMAGAFGVFVGAPFSNVTSVLQFERGSRMDAKLMRRLLTQSGSLWRGATPPVLGGALYSCTSFPCYRVFSGAILKRRTKPETRRDVAERAFVAGTLSGWVSVLFSTPLEHVKTKLQLSPASPGGTSGAFRNETARLWRAGGLRALYTGLPCMMWRDGPGTGIYFATYVVTKAELSNAGFSAQSAELLAGGTAGVACWAPVMPLEVARTRIHAVAYSHSHGADAVVPSTTRVLRDAVREEGVHSLFRGLLPISVRAFLVNAATFFVYESLVRVATSPASPVSPATVTGTPSGPGKLKSPAAAA